VVLQVVLRRAEHHLCDQGHGRGSPALDFQPAEAAVIPASASCGGRPSCRTRQVGDAARALAGYGFRMSPRDPRLQAAALRLAAERVERGEILAPELADALANDMARHPEDLAAIEAHEGPLPQWMAEELDRRDREDAGTEDDGDVVMARLLAKHSRRRQSA
jgi:hypothetical protein